MKKRSTIMEFTCATTMTTAIIQQSRRQCLPFGNCKGWMSTHYHSNDILNCSILLLASYRNERERKKISKKLLCTEKKRSKEKYEYCFSSMKFFFMLCEIEYGQYNISVRIELRIHVFVHGIELNCTLQITSFIKLPSFFSLILNHKLLSLHKLFNFE